MCVCFRVIFCLFKYFSRLIYNFLFSLYIVVEKIKIFFNLPKLIFCLINTDNLIERSSVNTNDIMALEEKINVSLVVSEG